MPKLVLPSIISAECVKKLSLAKLIQLCSEIREKIITIVEKDGGHLGSPLGAVELTVAAHYVFNIETDKFIFDIGHQSHAHKLITGRQNIKSFSSLINPKESKYDHFIGGHSSISIVAMMGMLQNRQIQTAICFIGDASMSSGVAFEGLNIRHTIEKGQKAIIILNDNGMSIDTSVGALSDHLKTISKSRNFFTSLGWKYIGKVDGHNMRALIKAFKRARDSKLDGTFVIHVKTIKGFGLTKSNAAFLHAIKAGNNNNHGEKINHDRYFNTALGNALEIEMKKNKNIIAVSPAMITSSGLGKLKLLYPDRIIDVGIAEHAAVTMCAGATVVGLIPFCVIYSTFLQRGYDAIIHDVSICSYPVKFMICSASSFSSHGPTHQGMFDVAFLRIIPNMIIMAPSSIEEFLRMIQTCMNIKTQPCAIRYPNVANIIGNTNSKSIIPIKVGRAKIIKHGSNVCFVSFGIVLNAVLEATNELPNVSVIDARFAKPIDELLFENFAMQHNAIICVEDGCIGGFGSSLQEFLLKKQYKGSFYQICYEDEFLPLAPTKGQSTNWDTRIDFLIKLAKPFIN